MWVCWYGCQSGLYVSLKKMCVCVYAPVMCEREKLCVLWITNPTTVYAGKALLESNGNLNKTKSQKPHFLRSTSNLELNLFRCMALILFFLMLHFLCSTCFIKCSLFKLNPLTFFVYIFYNFFNVNNNLPRVFFQMRPNLSLYSQASHFHDMDIFVRIKT